MLCGCPHNIFNSCDDLEIFSVITGCLSLLMVLFLIIIVASLSISLHKVKKQMAQKSLLDRLDLHSYNNPAIQPNEELAVRGYSMFTAQEDSRASITPPNDYYTRNINPHFQSPADRAPHVQEKDQYFGNFDPQPRQGRYVY